MDSARPPSRTAAIATTPVASRRVLIKSDLYALLPKPSLHFPLDLREVRGGSRLEAHHYHRLRVRCTDQSPTIGKLHPHAIHRYHLVADTEMLYCALYDSELDVVGTFDTYLGSGDEPRHVGKKLFETLSGVGDDLE